MKMYGLLLSLFLVPSLLAGGPSVLSVRAEIGQTMPSDGSLTDELGLSFGATWRRDGLGIDLAFDNLDFDDDVPSMTLVTADFEVWRLGLDFQVLPKWHLLGGLSRSEVSYSTRPNLCPPEMNCERQDSFDGTGYYLETYLFVTPWLAPFWRYNETGVDVGLLFPDDFSVSTLGVRLHLNLLRR